MTEIIGWISSLILVLTIGKQIHRQWQEGSSEGVSKWLFVGQIAASLGFTIYSWLIHNWVFVVTNSLMLLNGLLGYYITQHFRRYPRSESTNTSTNAETAASRQQEKPE